MLVDVPKLY